MVLSSFSPLFVIWAIRGTQLLPDPIFIGICLLLAIAPTLALWARIRIAQSRADLRSLSIRLSEDSRSHILVYLFAMLLPFYGAAVSTWRDLGATFAALAAIIYLFWQLDLHYVNILFAIRGYRVYTILADDSANPISGKSPLILITPRRILDPGELAAYRLSDTVYLEMIDEARL